MTYFSNGTEGDIWETRNCVGCVHRSEEKGCPVLVAHLIGNHDQHGDDPKAVIVRDILATLIPMEGVFPGPCAMRLPASEHEAQEAVVQANEDRDKALRSAGWFKRHISERLAEGRAADLLEAAAADGLEPKPVVVTFHHLQENRDSVAMGWPDESILTARDRLSSMADEIGRMSGADTLDIIGVTLSEADRGLVANERADAVGSLIVALAGYASSHKLDLEKCVHDVWRAIRGE